MASCGNKPLTVGSLFSGIGGLDLGLERAGMRVIWQSEIDPYACKVLAKHWPEVPNLGDIKRINFADVVRPDVICGGYPCQPFSTAGQRKGEEDPRHLWPWVREAIRVLRPRYAILENVRGHLSLGGTTVLSEIAALGYSAEWRVVSAASVGANHRRDRIIIVAYPNQQNESDLALYGERQTAVGMVADTDSSHAADGRQRAALPSEDRSGRNDRGGSDSDPRQVALRSAGEDPSHVADPTSEPGKHERQDNGEALVTKYTPLNAGSDSGRHDRSADGQLMADPEVFGCYGRRHGDDSSRSGAAWVQQQIRRSGSDYAGAANWQTEPDVGRVANGVPARVDRLKGLGNAVVPQVAEVIGRLVVAHAGT